MKSESPAKVRTGAETTTATAMASRRERQLSPHVLRRTSSHPPLGGRGYLPTDPSGIPGQQIVRPSDIEVISPTPNGAEDGPPSGAYLTLTTCHPKYSARQRLIIHAGLEGDGLTKTEMPDGPPALRES